MPLCAKHTTKKLIEVYEKEIKKTSTLAIVSKQWNIWNNFNQVMKDPYTEIRNRMIKQIGEDLHKRKDIPRLWFRRINLVKMLILFKPSIGYGSPYKNSNIIFPKVEKQS